MPIINVIIDPIEYGQLLSTAVESGWNEAKRRFLKHRDMYESLGVEQFTLMRNDDACWVRLKVKGTNIC